MFDLLASPDRVPARPGGGARPSRGTTRAYLGLAPAAGPTLVNRGPFPPLTEWFLVQDGDVLAGLAWHAWRALTAALGGDWGQRLLQYVPTLPTYGGWAQLRPGQSALDYGVSNRALLYLTTQQPEGFGTQWCAWHSADDAGNPYAFQPTAAVPGCGDWMPDYDWLTIPLSHELAELLTDPEPGTPSGWVAADGEENADLCNWQRHGVLAPALDDWPAFEYGVTKFWSNADGRCGP